jgi:hypothetical protein
MKLYDILAETRIAIKWQETRRKKRVQKEALPVIDEQDHLSSVFSQ